MFDSINKLNPHISLKVKFQLIEIMTTYFSKPESKVSKTLKQAAK